MERRTVPWMEPGNIERLRERLGVSWVDLAALVGVSYQTLYRIRKGESAGLPIVQNRVYSIMQDAGMYPPNSEYFTMSTHHRYTLRPEEV